MMRAARAYVKYAQAQLMSTMSRLRNPIRKKMWSVSQNHHAKIPEKRRFGNCATAECRPMVASAPQS